jgi:glycosyltransferase involved in cell wall biosynthesis
MTPTEKPLVSVVTPVFNGEAHLRECLDSVLAQTYTNWDCTVVNNCSTDRTLDIAREYAARDARIRIHNNDSFLRIIANYNNAFRQASAGSRYCKVLAADDWLFPECLEKMVDLAEEHPDVAIVGAYGYGFDGEHVVWDGLPYSSRVLPGREACRAYLLGGPYVFGTPTSLLFRSDIVRSRHAFYNEDNLHADTEACLEFLAHHNFGFVHQVLTYSRVQHDSATGLSQRFNTYLPGSLYVLKKYGSWYLDEAEFERVFRERMRNYYRYLGRQVYKRRKREFWSYHQEKLAELDLPLSWIRVAVCAVPPLFGALLSPARTADVILQRLRRSVTGSSSS